MRKLHTRTIIIYNYDLSDIIHAMYEVILRLTLALNRTLLLNNGIEKYIRKAKQNHESCRDAATDALRDLGLDDYNL